MASIPLLLRLWFIVLVANVAGAALGTLVVVHAHILSPESMAAADNFVKEAMTLSWTEIFFRALFAGWLVAGVIWIGTAARDTITRFVIVYFVFFTIAACRLFHVMTVAAEVFFVAFYHHSFPELSILFNTFWLPVFLGNTAGGVLVFTFVAYAQSERMLFPEVRVLSPQEMLFSMKGGKPFKPKKLSKPSVS
jgi:formate/nitrite transporter FocA (FNT family)